MTFTSTRKRIRRSLKAIALSTCLLIFCLGMMLGSNAQQNPGASKADSTPKVEGHQFVMFGAHPIPEPRTDAEKQTLARQLRGGTLEEPQSGKAPSIRRSRGGVNYATTGAVGMRYDKNYLNASIFQYTNDGAKHKDTACGQAAIATLITAWGVKAPDNGSALIREVESNYPQDVALGNAGTSWQQMEKALNGYGLKTYWLTGEAELKEYLKAGYPVVVMLDVGRIPQYGFTWSGHWVVAYAFDYGNIYVTNWNLDGTTCSWGSFSAAWNTWLTNASGTTRRGLVAYR